MVPPMYTQPAGHSLPSTKVKHNANVCEVQSLQFLAFQESCLHLPWICNLHGIFQCWWKCTVCFFLHSMAIILDIIALYIVSFQRITFEEKEYRLLPYITRSEVLIMFILRNSCPFPCLLFRYIACFLVYFRSYTSIFSSVWFLSSFKTLQIRWRWWFYCHSVSLFRAKLVQELL